ncbi:MAG: SCO family protein, partial [Ktedonobacterales bacterium]
MAEQHPAPQPRRTARAIISMAIVVALAAGAIFGFTRLATHFSSPGGASGQSSAPGANQGVLLGGDPAPAFTLKDQTGATVTLDSLKGKPTVFTFFDSLCPHTDCSLMAQYINDTAQDMGGDASRVNWVALSLNPWHDTRQSVNAFIATQKLSPQVRYLMGSMSQLQPLWNAFHMQSIEQSNGIVIHTTGVYLLDSQTRELVFLDEGFDPHILSADARLVITKGDEAFAGQQGAQTSSMVTQTHTANTMQVTLTSAPGQYGSYDFTVLLADAGGIAIPNAHVSL